MTDQIPYDPDFDAPKTVSPSAEISARAPQSGAGTSFFDGFSPKSAFVFGVITAIGVLSIIGSIVLLKLFW